MTIEEVEHTKTQEESPQAIEICERFYKTSLNELYRVAFRKNIYRSLAQMQADVGV